MRIAVAGLILALAAGQTSFGQSIFATLVGTVSDSTSAVIPNAKITVTNVSTKEKREFTTTESGRYEINNLFPGVYMLEAEIAGFSRFRREGISLASNENARIDVTLEVSGEVTRVTVSTEAGPRIETESARLTDVRDLRQLQTLPLGGRGPQRWLELSPGVTGGMTGALSISGARERLMHYTVDGVTMSDVRSNNTIGPTWNFMEAFEEAKIDLGNNSAEFKALGTVTLSTKRGGNQVHGSVYDYYSTGAFRARDYFTGSRSGTPSHGFGTYLSGPVILPRLYNGRDKTRNGASHTYQALNLEVERRFAKGLMFQTSFTFLKDLGDEDVTPENTFDRARERAQNQLQPYRRWTGFFIYELPFGKGKPLGGDLQGVAGHLLGGWEVSAVGALQDGQNETPL